MIRLTLLLALALSACASPPATPPPATPPSGAPPSSDPPAAAGALRLVTDSLVVRDGAMLYRASVGYPQIAGASAAVLPEALARANASLRAPVVALADAYHSSPEDGPLDPSDRVRMDGRFEEAFLGHGVASALVWVDTDTGGVRPLVSMLPLAVDLRTGEPVRLDDLFQPGAAWPEVLSERAGRVLDAAGWFSPGSTERFAAAGYLSPEVMRTAGFTLGRDSLVVHFPPYALGVAWDPLRVPVAYADLAPLMRTDGAAGRLRAGR